MPEIELSEMGAHRLSGLPFEELTEEQRLQVGKDFPMNIPAAIVANWTKIQGKDAWILIHASKFDDELASVTSGVIAINMGRFEDRPQALAVAEALQSRISFCDDPYKGICALSDVLVDPTLKPEAQSPSIRQRLHVWWDKPYEAWKTTYKVNE